MEVGFKWQLLTLDKERKWIPSTALITSIYAPTGGTSVLGSHTVEPYVNLIYGWGLTDKLTVGGSTGYLGMRVTDLGPGRPADSFQRYHQSLLAFYSVNKRTTLFYEWYVWMFTHAMDNRPTHYMDGGILYLLSPNMQLDLRAASVSVAGPTISLLERVTRCDSESACRRMRFAGQGLEQWEILLRRPVHASCRRCRGLAAAAGRLSRRRLFALPFDIAGIEFKEPLAREVVGHRLAHRTKLLEKPGSTGESVGFAARRASRGCPCRTVAQFGDRGSSTIA